MKKAITSTILAGVISLINPAVAVCSLPPVSLRLDNAIAQTDETVELPPPVAEGLALYKAGKVEAAFNLWLDNMLTLLKSIPAESEQEITKKELAIRMFSQFRANFATIATSLSNQHGVCKGYKIIKIVKLNENIQNIYLKSLHQQGSIFMKFTTLRTEKGWAIFSFSFSPDIEDIFK